jgi:hypothetical protein
MNNSIAARVASLLLVRNYTILYMSAIIDVYKLRAHFIQRRYSTAGTA